MHRPIGHYRQSADTLLRATDTNPNTNPNLKQSLSLSHKQYTRRNRKSTHNIWCQTLRMYVIFSVLNANSATDSHWEADALISFAASARHIFLTIITSCRRSKISPLVLAKEWKGWRLLSRACWADGSLTRRRWRESWWRHMHRT